MTEKPRPGLISGIALLAVGLLILIPSGLCTGIFGGGALLDAIMYPGNGGDSASMLGMALIIGGPFVILGAVLVRFGIRRLRAK
jgi:hypothetical protein